jgi:hypothetical protein
MLPLRARVCCLVGSHFYLVLASIVLVMSCIVACCRLMPTMKSFLLYKHLDGGLA